MTVYNHYLYLFVDYDWGDNRGFAWYTYNNEPYATMLLEAWGGAVLINAHNEWLNSLLCSGAFELISYLGIFCSVDWNCVWRIARFEIIELS